MNSDWTEDLIELAKWSLQSQDLRYKYLYAASASDVSKTPGIVWVLETAAVLGIYEAAIGKGFKGWESIEHEKPYPGEDGKNPRRADLAIKGKGAGKNWAYIEVKYYGQSGKSLIASDIEKLKSIEKRTQRWMLIYRVRSTSRQKNLSQLLKNNFNDQISIEKCAQFQTISDSEDWPPGLCEICLLRIN